MVVIMISAFGSSDYDQITMGIETRRNIVIITTDIFAVYSMTELKLNQWFGGFLKSINKLMIDIANKTCLLGFFLGLG